MARRKQAALDVPATTEEAVAVLEQYVSAERDVLALKVYAARVIDQTKTARDQQIAAIEEGQKVRFASLKAWWEAGGRELARDKRSHELAGAKIGVRLSPPAVKLAKGLKVDAVVTWLRRAGDWAIGFVRPKYELDKPALIKAVGADEAVRERFAAEGVTVVQADEFFIDAGLDEAALATESAGDQPV